MTRSRTLVAAAWTLAVLAVCLVPGTYVPEVPILSADKLVHIALFAGFAALWLWAGASRWAVLVAGLAFGVLIEVLQNDLPIGRSGDPFDAVADAIGVALALALWPVLRRGREQLRGRTRV